MTEAEYYNVAGNAAATMANLAGTFSTNMENKKLMREQMRFNEKMFEAQKEYNWDMFNAVNAYNTPSAQLERFRQAGINPAMAMSGVNPVEAQGGSVNPPSAPGAPTMQAPDFSGLSRIGDTIYNSELREKQLEAMDIANRRAQEMETFEKESHVYDLLNKGNEVEEGKWRNTDWYQRTLLNNWLFRDRVDQSRLDTLNKQADFDLKQLQNIGLKISNAMDKMRLNNLPKELSAQLALLAAQKFAAMGQGASGYASAKASVALAAKYGAETVGINLSNQQAQAIAGSAMVAAIAENNAKTLRFENESADQLDLQRFLYGDGDFQQVMRYGKQAMSWATSALRGIFK